MRTRPTVNPQPPHCSGTGTGNTRRQGFVLLVVLVVVVLLSLGAYSFSELMLVEYEAATNHGRALQARALADSGIEYIAARLADRSDRNPETFYHAPSSFQAFPVSDGGTSRTRGYFSAVAPLDMEGAAQPVRYGLVDESSRLNVNTLLKLPLKEEQARELLLQIPGMTEEIADAILDFVDENTETRQFGAESDFYQSLSPPYNAKNGKLDSLDELLLVRGVTPALLFGEDANRNGLLDPNENDGEASLPFDNADGVLDRGWQKYLTVFSRETNLRSDGEMRINVNHSLLTELYDNLEQEMGEQIAKFVIAYRVSGPYTPSSSSGSSSGSGGSSSGGRSSGGASGGSSSGGSSSGSSAQTVTAKSNTGTGSAKSVAATTSTDVSAGNLSGDQVKVLTAISQAITMSGSAPVTRGGIDLSRGGRIKAKSLYDLVGIQVRVTIDSVQTVLDSPWPEDAGSMKTYLPEMFDKLTVKKDEFLEGRINVNEASKEVLMGVPEMTEELATAIVAAQSRGVTGESLSGQISDRATTGWLVADGLVDLPTMRKLDPYLTARGDVFRAQVVGFFEGGGPAARVEAVIDATQNPPRILFIRDLSELGRGYPLSLLAPGGGP